MPRTQILEIPLLKLDWPSNVRQIFEPEGLASLAKTIKSHGLQQNIGVYLKDERYVGIYGQRRSMAAKLAGFTTISAMVWPAEPTVTELSELQLIENTQREDLRPTEHAAALAKYMAASGMNAAEMAERLGMSPPRVSRSLKLLGLSLSIREQVDRGVIPASSAYEIAKIDDPKEQAEMASRIMEGRLTRDGVSGELKAKKRLAIAPSAKPLSRVTALLGAGRAVTLCGPGLDLESVITCLEDLLARARKIRPQGLELKTFIKMLKDQSKA